MQKVEDESDIILDIMICDYSEDIGEDKSGNTVNNWFQARSIHHYYNDSNDVNKQEAPYPLVNYRYYF